MPQEPDWRERGYYWATRFTTTRNTFNYMPDRVYDNMEVDLFGRPLDQEEVCNQVGCVPLEAGQERFIVGMCMFYLLMKFFFAVFFLLWTREFH